MKPKQTQIQKHDHPYQLHLEETEVFPGVRRKNFALEAMDRRQRADSFWHQLTDQQQSTLIRWLHSYDLSDVLDRIAAPPPDGFGMKTHITTLTRLRSSWKATPINSGLREMLDTMEEIETESDLSQLERIQHGISHMLHEKAFELARTSPGHEIIPRILTSIEKLSALEYKRQKLVLDREKLKTNRYHRVDLNIVPPQPRQPSMKTVTAVSDPERGCVGDQPQHIRPAEPLSFQNQSQPEKQLSPAATGSAET